MNKPDKMAVVRKIACHALECIEAVAKKAKATLSSRRTGRVTPFASINTFVDRKALENLVNIQDEEEKSLKVLSIVPVIARIQLVDDDGREETIFVTRTTPPSITGFKIASYRVPLGKLAARPVGEEVAYPSEESNRYMVIDNTTQLNPKIGDDLKWDSLDSVMNTQHWGAFTVDSLREACFPGAIPLEDDLDELWSDEADVNIVDGVRRAILTRMSLRDQPVLDEIQDAIFRMPINSQCFLSGPPGTGKTTTLIRRIGQKTDKDALVESNEDIQLLEQAQEETGRLHEGSWVLFSPTELLRQYVKEAFAREGLVASDDHIRTWQEFRREIARENLALLRTSSRKGAFVERPNVDYFMHESSDIDEAKWYDEFRSYLDATNAQELKSEAEWLAKNESTDLSDIGNRLSKSFDSISLEHDFYTQTTRAVSTMIPDVRKAAKERNDAISKILTQARNVITSKDREFPNRLRDEISRQMAFASIDTDDYDDIEATEDDEEDQIFEIRPGKSLTLGQARLQFESTVKALARAKARGRKIRSKSRHGQLLTWLGENRLPSNKDIDALGILLIERQHLNKLTRLEQLFVRSISRTYKNFRIKMAKEGRWYKSAPVKRTDIHWQELDLVILAGLQIANELLKNYRRSKDTDLPTGGILGAVRYLQRAQVLVDEATDFSRVQLACMYEIAHPSVSSFFLCGDVNQRLTSWGIKSNGDFDWVKPEMLHKTISISYRQSGYLVDLAKQLAKLDGSRLPKITLPNRVDDKGVRPVWKANLKTNSQVAQWLTKRIFEVDSAVGATTVAVLVNGEESVANIALELNKRLQEINLSAVACKDGRVVGNDRDVRVFNIDHIKGLEFEVVFFVGLDQTIENYPRLFSKYLYVGATRAATYLGVTFSGGIHEQVLPLEKYFQEEWSERE